MLLAVVTLWAVLQLFRTRLDPLFARLSTPSTRVSLSPMSLDLTTTALNSLPVGVLRVLPRVGRTRSGMGERRRLGGFYDAGAVVVLAGCIVAQGVLVAAGGKALVALARLAFGRAATPPPMQLARRALAATLPSTPETAAADSLLLRPLIPGFTTPLSLLPTLVAALVVSQGVHELGHALAAACERIPLHAAHARLYLLLLPTLAVELPAPSATGSSPRTDLRVTTAGIWHNVVLALLALAAVEEGGGALSRRMGEVVGVWERMGEGVKVVAVSPTSPLAPHLPPGTHITHLDDLELDAASISGSGSTAALWRADLRSHASGRSADSYEHMGWCLSAAGFEPGSAEGCCAAPAAQGQDAPGPRVCFEAPAPPHTTAAAARLQACLDPLPLLPPSRRAAPRCVDAASCSGEGAAGSVCARISEREGVLRIGVEDLGVEGGRRTVLYQGSRGAVARQVTVTDLVSRHWFFPDWLPQTLEAFYSAVLSLSLALAFFNALPLPHLDGTHILSALLCALGAADELPLSARAGRTVVREDSGLLERGIEWAAGWRLVKAVVRRRERVERGVERWTVGVAAVTLVASGAVELSSWWRGL